MLKVIGFNHFLRSSLEHLGRTNRPQGGKKAPLIVSTLLPILPFLISKDRQDDKQLLRGRQGTGLLGTERAGLGVQGWEEGGGEGETNLVPEEILCSVCFWFLWFFGVLECSLE